DGIGALQRLDRHIPVAGEIDLRRGWCCQQRDEQCGKRCAAHEPTPMYLTVARRLRIAAHRPSLAGPWRRGHEQDLMLATIVFMVRIAASPTTFGLQGMNLCKPMQCRVGTLKEWRITPRRQCAIAMPSRASMLTY